MSAIRSTAGEEISCPWLVHSRTYVTFLYLHCWFLAFMQIKQRCRYYYVSEWVLYKISRTNDRKNFRYDLYESVRDSINCLSSWSQKNLSLFGSNITKEKTFWWNYGKCIHARKMLHLQEWDKSKYSCSECSKERGSEHWICHSSTGRNCFVRQLHATHLSS